MTIAVLDSGITRNHKSFSSFLEKSSSVKTSPARTGTDDRWTRHTRRDHSSGRRRRLTVLTKQSLLVQVWSTFAFSILTGGHVAGVLSALDWLISNKGTYNIRVVNMSLGTAAINSYKNDPICNAVRKLVDSGVMVVAAAGNNGKDANGQKIYGAIHCPGNEPSAVTVGASNSYGTDPRNDDSVTTYSSRGPTRSVAVDDYGLKH